MTFKTKMNPLLAHTPHHFRCVGFLNWLVDLTTVLSKSYVSNKVLTQDYYEELFLKIVAVGD